MANRRANPSRRLLGVSGRDEMLAETRRQFTPDLPTMPPRLFWLSFGVGVGVFLDEIRRGGIPDMEWWLAVPIAAALGVIFGWVAALGMYFVWLWPWSVVVYPLFLWLRGRRERREAEYWAEAEAEAEAIAEEEESRRKRREELDR